MLKKYIYILANLFCKHDWAYYDKRPIRLCRKCDKVQRRGTKSFQFNYWK